MLLQNDTAPPKPGLANRGDEKQGSDVLSPVRGFPDGLREQTNGTIPNGVHKDEPGTPAQADETALHSYFPPVSSHYPFVAIQFYYILSFFLSLAFLICTVTLAMVKTIPSIGWVCLSWLQCKDPDRHRPFYKLEKSREKLPRGKLKVDVGYYAKLLCLDTEEFTVETEDGFILTVQHIIDRRPGATDWRRTQKSFQTLLKIGKYPVLIIPGLMQSSGAFCVNDDDSLAFFLCKSGYDVWLGNNRGYFKPRHKSLKPSNPQFWAWNLRHMANLDIPALVNIVRSQTTRTKIALIAHSQGTALSFLALAKDQCPQLGDSISCFIALAPAVFAGSLLRTFQFSFVRVMSTRLYRAFFGIHAFIPLMMVIHRTIPRGMYGWLGYRVFNYLFSWTDLRWERRLRNRFFQFAPVYVSAECMRWWLGRGTTQTRIANGGFLTLDCFAKRRCILFEEDTWYDSRMPPVSLFIGGRDKLVDGKKLVDRLREKEPHVKLLRAQIDEDYQHLDCIWSLDCIERVAGNIRVDIWGTVGVDDVVTPEGCDDFERGAKIAMGKDITA